MTSITKDEIYEMDGTIRYIKLSGDYDKFNWWKEKIEAVDGHKEIQKYLEKEVDIQTKDEADNDEETWRSMKETPRHGISLYSGW